MRRFFMNDEDLGKKDDDHKTPKNGLRPPNWHPARVPPRRSLKRIGIALLVAVLIFVFFKNIPVLGPDARMRRPNYVYPDSPANVPRVRPPTGGSPSPPRTPASSVERTFNGPVMFPELAPTLHVITGTRGSMVINRNVLFAVSSLKSAATLLPVACQMATELKSYVHFALMSRSDIKFSELRSINGISDSCQVIFHDARPDHAPISIDERMEHAVFRAFHHINIYMHPQAIIVDGSDDEELYFLRASRHHSRATQSTLIELPQKSTRSLTWMTKLDSAALRMWDKIQVDIIVQAQPGSSGSLIRLLKSLSAADYPSNAIPHLTIELPHDVDPPTKQYLESFLWPPAHANNPTHARYLTLRHRIPDQRMAEEESSIRFLESFWPAHPQHSHVLVLSPRAEVSPNFFHYLKYSLLEYRYSTVSTYQQWAQRLFGISLDQPVQLLDGKEPFSPPTMLKPSSAEEGDEVEISTPFLWQAPTSNAVLFIGEKWVELHDFISRSLAAKRDLEDTPALLSEKVVSTRYPSWLEHALRLCRARGYWTLYPGEDMAQNLATVHNELYHYPEEYAGEEKPKPLLSDDANDEEAEAVRQRIQSGSEIPLAPISLLESLPNDGNLRPFGDLPLVTWDGQPTDAEELKSLAEKYAAEFRAKVGGCDAKSSEEQQKKKVEDKKVSISAEDLFCAAES
ncbi:hypothetical protein F4809DRAFT_44549 [Biscogniauxia mediterranea]|nr:hypothetical protein F4809DRAFT_44549 [Biscogniauxia mediterranea]